MEVGVRVDSENPSTGEVNHNSSAYLTFVSLDENKKPTKVPGLILQSETEKRRFEEAKKRRELKLQYKNSIKR